MRPHIPGTRHGLRALLLLILLPPLLLACKAPAKAAGSDPTAPLSRSDETLARIARDARDRLPLFIRRVQSPLPGDGNFRVKYPFAAKNGSGFSHEQIWLAGITFQEGRYYGIVSNSPYYVTGLKTGDRVPINIEEITDWMYTKNGVIEGGISIKYLLEQIPTPDRTAEQRQLLKMFP
ncbi:hypothetical protein AGMMS50268_32370 [Spirochaetia bacterium]|nr:hypothetical protein AGMMS50268_32370 [Spirochaetia bacterium]